MTSLALLAKLRQQRAAVIHCAAFVIRPAVFILAGRDCCFCLYWEFYLIEAIDNGNNRAADIKDRVGRIEKGADPQRRGHIGTTGIPWDQSRGQCAGVFQGSR